MRIEKYCKETKQIIVEIQKMFNLDGNDKKALLDKVDEIIRGKRYEKKHRNFITKI